MAALHPNSVKLCISLYVLVNHTFSV